MTPVDRRRQRPTAATCYYISTSNLVSTWCVSLESIAPNKELKDKGGRERRGGREGGGGGGGFSTSDSGGGGGKVGGRRGMGEEWKKNSE